MGVVLIVSWCAVAVAAVVAALLGFHLHRTRVMRREQTRPWVVAARDGADNLVVTNTGTTGAYSVEVRPPGTTRNAAAIPVLAPAATVRRPIDGLSEAGIVEVTYRGSWGTYRDLYELPGEREATDEAALPGPGERRGLGRGLRELLRVDDRPVVTVVLEHTTPSQR